MKDSNKKSPMFMESDRTVVSVTLGMETEVGWDENAPVVDSQPIKCKANPEGHAPAGTSWEQILEARRIPADTRCVCGATIILY